jgi:hypothetical protein
MIQMDIIGTQTISTNGKPGYSGSSNGWVGAFIKMSALSNKTM